MTFSRKLEWVSTDGWRGYERPVYAIAGSSDTGMWSDSPCPSDRVKAELTDLKKHLRSKGIHYREIITKSSNVFMIKHWLISSVEQFEEAVKVAEAWLKDNHAVTNHIHER